MYDLLLWRLLHQEPLDPVRVTPLLCELRHYSVPQRLPYLGLLPRCLEHSDPSLRTAALHCLAGVTGVVGYRHLVTALRDPEESVRLTAVVALREAAQHDASRWVHALFHPDPIVRKAAVAPGSSQPLGVQYLLH